MSTIYVDEAKGSDETGSGTQESPYQTLAFAIFKHAGASLLSRKDASATYEEPTQSALKKAKKGADGLEKKRKKAEELAEREAKHQREERERREKQIEESKKIVLTEDASLPKAKKVWFIASRRCAHSSHLHTRLSLANFLLCEASVSAFLVGYIVSVIRKVSCLSSFAMVLDTSNVFSLAVW